MNPRLNETRRGIGVKLTDARRELEQAQADYAAGKITMAELLKVSREFAELSREPMPSLAVQR
jgi:hypothetical protein